MQGVIPRDPLTGWPPALALKSVLKDPRDTDPEKRLCGREGILASRKID
jgi:hypothetical protein